MVCHFWEIWGKICDIWHLDVFLLFNQRMWAKVEWSYRFNCFSEFKSQYRKRCTGWSSSSFGVLEKNLLTQWPSAAIYSHVSFFPFLPIRSSSFNHHNEMMCWVSGVRAICVHAAVTCCWKHVYYKGSVLISSLKQDLEQNVRWVCWVSVFWGKQFK